MEIPGGSTGLAKIDFPNRLLRRKQPSVLVHLSRVQDGSFRENPACLLFHDSTLTVRQCKTWISVGTLPLLAISDIWRDGQLEPCPDYELEHFTDLEINGETGVLIKAGLNLEDKGFHLPRAEHPWHMQCTQSYCLMVDLPLDRRLIILCVEMVRFYFGSSSNLLTKLFFPPLSHDVLYSKPHFDKATGRLSLELVPNISGASAADIGRLHVDAAAWRAAAHVGASLLKGSVSGQGAYPQAFFPFEGQTNLVASGKWLSLGDDPKRTFLVPVHMKLYLPSATIDELSEVLPCVAADFILRPEPKNGNVAELIRHVFGTNEATFD